MLRAPRARAVAPVVVLMLIAAALLATACGSEKSSPTTTAGGGGGAHGAPLRVGLVVNATGPGANGEDNAPKVIDAWAKAVNARGGVAGHPVELKVADTKGDAPTATSAVTHLLQGGDVDAIVMFDAETEGVYANAIAKAGVPVVGGMGYAPTAWGKLPNWLSLTTSFPAVIDMPMVRAKQLGSRTTSFAVCAEYPTCAAATPIAQHATQALGMAFGGTLKLSSSAPDFTAECLQIKKRGVDFVALGLPTATAMRIAADCKTQGYAGKWGIFDGTVWPKEMAAHDAGAPMTVELTSFPWFADDAPVAAYRKLMDEHGVPEVVWADPHSTAAYATMELLEKALDADAAALKGDPTPQGVIAAYGKVKQETLGGLLPQPITFTPNKPQPPVKCYWFADYADRKFSGAHLGAPVCDPPALGRS
jgi:branched-chain amino acid transport system substrate-binding protein